MFFKFLKINIFLIFLSSFCSAEVINDIIVKNNNRISKETIITYGNIILGNDYSDNEMNTVFKNLYETDFFKDISFEINNNVLIIEVVENKIIQDVLVNGVKNKSLKELILKNLSMKAKSPFIETKVVKDIALIQNGLGMQGFYFSKVSSSVKENSNGTIDLIYDLDLGDQVKLSRIEFTGDKKIKDRALRNLILSEESKFWKFISKKKFLKKKQILTDERLLKNFYLNEGYYDVVINSSTASLLDDKTFKLTYNINAGNKFTINKTKLILPLDYNKENFKKVKKLLNKVENKQYSFARISKIVKEIDRISLSREYDFITADIIEEKISDNKINLTLEVSETEKLYVERINIYGNTITQENVIRNSFEVDEGDPFNELLQAKTLNNIKSLNIFSEVDSLVTEGSTPAQKIIDITVAEKPTGEISLGAGYGSEGGTVGFAVSENNFLGKGVRLSTSLRATSTTVRGNFNIYNPNFNYTGKALSTNIQSSVTDKLSSAGFESTKNGFSLGTSYEQFEDVRFSPKFSIYVEDLKTTALARKTLKKQEGSYFENRFSYNFDWDTRDKRYQPTGGKRSIFTQGIPLISDDYALLNGYDLEGWKKFDNGMVASLSTFTRMINSMNNQNVRLSNRLEMPKNKLRGFEAGKVGPKDGFEYVGGNYAATINFNTTLPMIFPSLEKIDFKYFLDVGNVWGVDYSSLVDDSNVIRSATGVAVDWFTPIGPLSFSMTQPLSKASSDRTEAFQFNLGTTF